MIVLAVCCSCSLLFKGNFEVSSWTPGEAPISDESAVTISVTFSGIPEKNSTERASSLFCDGQKIPFTAVWSGSVMQFVPIYPIEHGREYAIVVKKDACDINGNNLTADFIGFFKTKADRTRPVVVFTSPANNAALTQSEQVIEIGFSKPMDIVHASEGIVLVPEIPGYWRWKSDTEKQILVFQPMAAWTPDTVYQCTVGKLLKDTDGNEAGQEYRFNFKSSLVNTPPELVAIRRMFVSSKENEADKTKERNDISAALPGYSFLTNLTFSDSGGTQINELCETSDEIELEFSQPVNVFEASRRIQFPEGSYYECQTTEAYASILRFKPLRRAQWNKLGFITVYPGIPNEKRITTKKQYLSALRMNGQISKPPKILSMQIMFSTETSVSYNQTGGIVLPEEYMKVISSPVLSDVENNISGSDSSGANAYLLIKFELAPCADINVGSIGRVFQFSPTGSMRCSVIAIRDTLPDNGQSGGGTGIPFPPGTGGNTPSPFRTEGYLYVRFYIPRGSNSAVFRFGPGILDSRGNMTTEETLFSVVFRTHSSDYDPDPDPHDPHDP